MSLIIPAIDYPWMQNAKKELCITEEPGAKNNPRILWYHTFTTLKSSYDSISWCAAFANAMLITAGIRGSRSAAALDFTNWGIELEYSEYGCLAIWDWNNGHGHVAFVLDEDEDKGLYVIGGNQRQNGLDKVCQKWFPWSTPPSYYKWPKEYPLPKEAEVDTEFMNG